MSKQDSLKPLTLSLIFPIHKDGRITLEEVGDDIIINVNFQGDEAKDLIKAQYGKFVKKKQDEQIEEIMHTLIRSATAHLLEEDGANETKEG